MRENCEWTNVRAVLDAASEFENRTGKKPTMIYFAKGEIVEASAQLGEHFNVVFPEGTALSTLYGMVCCTDIRLEPGAVRVDNVIL